MKKKIVILLFSMMSVNSLCSDRQSACCAPDEYEELLTFEDLLKEEENTHLLTLIRRQYEENFINRGLLLEEQQQLLNTGIQFLEKTTLELQTNPGAHLLSLEHMFGKTKDIKTVKKVYRKLLEQELIRKAQLEEEAAIVKATAQITKEERILAQEAERKQAALEHRRAEIRTALEKAQTQTRSAFPEKELAISFFTAERPRRQDEDTTDLLLLALDTLANKSDISTTTDYNGPGFCPVCGPLIEGQRAHTSYRHNGQKISLKGILSLKNLDTFVEKDLRDPRRKVIAKIIRALDQQYFSNPKIKQDLEMIFRYSWRH